ncbi:MAG: 30S ribosomal protein S8 [Saprospiraceae bacterium]|uniref:Small ribosomal subunit protein uS8 n=1 Tax=Candidatus Opimibacter skivensis TaxID=2982028 RepID=A0A9D7XPC6_9BACT|nr:30S ribosomal protein S8 [Candidatus Opimibacter skivensis]
MAITDPIADYLTRIRNAQQARHRVVSIPNSKLKQKITEILYEQGYILKYTFDGEGKNAVINIAIKYNPETKEPVIRELGRLSRPGLRRFSSSEDLPRIINGLGVAIISTSHGLMTDKEARKQKLGGECLCYVY